jgi:uncharacterized protein (TIGR02611 family)
VTTEHGQERTRAEKRERPRSDLIEKLQERRKRHRERHKLYRVGVVILGTVVTLAGIVMTGPVPGPGILIIPIGLALLALEFVWAERLLEKAVDQADKAKEKAANTTRAQRIASGIATALGIAAFLAASLLWDIPVLPIV